MQGLARILAGRPGPGVPLGTRKLELALQYPAGADRSPNAHSRAPGPKQRAQTARLGKSCLNNVNYSNVFPPKAWRAGFLAIPCGANPAKAPKGRSPAGISIDFAHAKRMKSLLKRAGDRQTGFDWPRAGRAPRARGGPAMLRIAGGPAGRKICPPKTALACRAAPGRQNPKAPTVS